MVSVVTVAVACLTIICLNLTAVSWLLFLLVSRRKALEQRYGRVLSWVSCFIVATSGAVLVAHKALIVEVVPRLEAISDLSSRSPMKYLGWPAPGLNTGGDMDRFLETLGKLSPEGVVLAAYPNDYFCFNAFSAAGFALAAYNSIRSLDLKGEKRERNRKYVYDFVDFFRKHREARDGGLFLAYDCDIPSSGIKKGFVSSLSQAAILGLFLRLRLFEDDGASYEADLDGVFSSFSIPVGRGGIRKQDKDGYTWFEEVPDGTIPDILNGHITATLSILEYFIYSGSEEAKELAREGLRTIRHYIPVYDDGVLVNYSSNRRSMVSRSYLGMEWRKAEWLFEITQDPFYQWVGRSWKELYEAREYGGFRNWDTRILGWTFPLNWIVARYMRSLQVIH